MVDMGVGYRIFAVHLLCFEFDIYLQSYRSTDSEVIASSAMQRVGRAMPC